MKLLDRDNLAAVLWSAVYCFSLVLLAGVFDDLGITPAITVPVAIVVLPIVIGGALAKLERSILGKADG
jgi:hypothetical protein